MEARGKGTSYNNGCSEGCGDGCSMGVGDNGSNGCSKGVGDSGIGCGDGWGAVMGDYIKGKGRDECMGAGQQRRLW